MGVTGLWSELKSAAIPRTYEKIALEVFDEAYEDLSEGKELDSGRLMGLRVGIDASAWFFHSNESEGGANPEVRNLFHRIIRLSKSGALGLFVFDGPHRPAVKRGNRIYRGEHTFQAPLIRIIEAFGYEWRVAPGEAEAELAMLSLRGDIDLLITDDVDSLLFGATRVLKHALVNNPSTSNTPTLYERHDIEMVAELSIPGLILVALMSGGDYDQTGLEGVGPTISIALAKGGYGEQLAEAIKTLSGRELDGFLSDFRDDIRHQLTTNEKRLLARKAAAVAKKIPDSWPDVKTAQRYYTPITSAVNKYKTFERKHDWSGRICVSLLTEIMDELFEYTHADILQKCRNQIWECVVVHHLVRALHRPAQSTSALGPESSPSKQLASALDDFSIHSPKKGSSSSSKKAKSKKHLPNIPDEVLPMFLRVTKSRTYNPGKKITHELQLFIDPASLVEEVRKHLQHPDPNIGKLRQRKEEEAARICAKFGPEYPGAVPAADRNSTFDDPDKEHKLWVQESLLRMAYPRLVEDWEEAEREKAEAKTNKGKGKASLAKAKGKAKASPKKALAKKEKEKRAVARSSDEEEVEEEEEEEEPDVFSSPEPAKKQKSKAVLPFRAVKKAAAPPIASKGKPTRKASETLSSSGSDSDIEIVAGPSRPKATSAVEKSPKKSPRRSHETTTARSASASADIPLKTAKSATSSQTLSSTTMLVPSKAVPKQTKKTYSYTELDGSDNDSDLPDLPMPLFFGKTDKGKGKEKEQAPVSIAMKKNTSISSSSSGSSSSITPSDGGSQSAGKITKAKKALAKPNRAAEVIDLCSSD